MMDQGAPQGAEESVLDLGASAVLLTLPAGIYAFSVKSGGARQHDPNGLTLPVVQISLAPVAAAGPVEFIMAPETLDRCLVRRSDVVLARIGGPGASLFLTSIRPADAPVMAIDVRRLDTDEEEVAEADPGRELGMPAAAPAVKEDPTAAAPSLPTLAMRRL